MTIFKSKKVKEVINNIRQEQQSMNNLERLEDWEEKYIFRTEQLEEANKMLDEKTFEANFAKENEESVKKYYQDLVLEEKKKIRALEKRLATKDEGTQISLLKEQHEKEIRELKNHQEIIEKRLYNSDQQWLEYYDKIKELEKELEEKELLNEYLVKELKNAWSAEDTHIEVMHDISKLAEEQHDKETKNLKEKLADKEATLNKERQEHDKQVKEANQKAEQSSKLLERKDLKISNLEREVEQLKSSLEATNKIIEKKDLGDREPYFFNKELPPLPKKESKFKQFKVKTKTKFRQFKQLVAKKKVQEREFVCRVEVGNK